jgi:GNAT superfamily N-acetyltransferase
MIFIYDVDDPEDVAHVRQLAWEFIDWLRERYPEQLDTINHYLNTQNFAAQLEDLLTYFGPPNGTCLLAKEDGVPLGIVMLKPREPGVCEMNRMYVRHRARRRGIGMALASRLIERARGIGYEEMVLSTLDRHIEALPLYEKLGFEIEHRAPDSGDAEHEICMRLRL